MGFRVLGFWARGNLPQTPSTDPSSLSALIDSDIKLAREDLVSTILMNPASQMHSYFSATFRLFEPRGCGLSSWVDASANPGLSKGHTHGTSIAYFVLLPMPLISTTVNSSAREPPERSGSTLIHSSHVSFACQ